ncbi:hypothetical protein PsorP6_017694 [Peronosclerospora sorghi]|uniref:Uncharacterized protein n=1 Tax=Peronosclerospora sorghi TaxID=230839 RepID=A0ACC0WNK6_9STRA|nr:hypothetical protein PsorP6_017694 [Peronosclerospora sorghi]
MVGVDLEIDESKLWDPSQRQTHMDTLPDMTLFEDHIVEGDEMVEAIQALIEDGESAESLALHWKHQGNDMFSDAKKAHRGYFKNGMKYYNDAIANKMKGLRRCMYLSKLIERWITFYKTVSILIQPSPTLIFILKPIRLYVHLFNNN